MGWTPGVTVERGSHGRLNSLSETRELESENYQTKPDRPTGNSPTRIKLSMVMQSNLTRFALSDYYQVINENGMKSDQVTFVQSLHPAPSLRLPDPQIVLDLIVALVNLSFNYHLI